MTSGFRLFKKKAHELFQGQINWAIFFREILGTNGIVHKLYPDGQSLAAFEKTREYIRLQEMLSELRDVNGQPPKPEEEGTRVITVRLPSCVHKRSRDEAHARDTSMNQLCISKLLQRDRCRAATAPTGNQEQANQRRDIARVAEKKDSERTYKPGSVRGGHGCLPGTAISLGSRLLGLSSSLPGSR